MCNLLQMIHSTVVDTSVVFPHKMGPPKKRALKTLCREHLNKIIQENGKSWLLAFFCFCGMWSIQNIFHNGLLTAEEMNFCEVIGYCHSSLGVC
jgi:hypothetical protein